MMVTVPATFFSVLGVRVAVVVTASSSVGVSSAGAAVCAIAGSADRIRKAGR